MDEGHKKPQRVQASGGRYALWYGKLAEGKEGSDAIGRVANLLVRDVGSYYLLPAIRPPLCAGKWCVCFQLSAKGSLYHESRDSVSKFSIFI